MATLTARIPDSIAKDLETASKYENIDKSALLRKLLTHSLTQWRENRAVELYKNNLASAEQAAHYARTSLWRFFELLKEKQVNLNYDKGELDTELKAIGWRPQ